MADELELSNETKVAIGKWVGDGAKGNLNEHLDSLGIDHPELLLPPPGGDGSDGIPNCPSGYYAKSSWVPIGGGKKVAVWTCEKA